MPAHFTLETLRFLRGLVKHNDRIWFEERRAVYERAAKEPLLAVVEAINAELAAFAPDFLRPPHKIAMRIYRDIRFSPDKRPYKRHLSAWWAREGYEKSSAPGFYLQVGPEASFAAMGIYAPERDDLLRVRRWMAEHYEQYREELAPLLKRKGRQLAMQPLDPAALTRNPKGFAPDHPASDLLRARNWGVVVPLTVEEALLPEFPTVVAAYFRRTVPLLELLHEPFAAAAASRAHPSFAL